MSILFVSAGAFFALLLTPGGTLADALAVLSLSAGFLAYRKLRHG